MREIKFRIWCPKHQSYAYYEDLLNTVVTLNGVTKNVGHWEHFDLGKDLVFQQFTGLHDKNGKEIYEGDIVEVNDWKYTIIFRGMGFWFVDSDDDGWVYDPNVYLITVLGNIYENSDLLNND